MRFVFFGRYISLIEVVIWSHASVKYLTKIAIEIKEYPLAEYAVLIVVSALRDKTLSHKNQWIFNYG